MSAHAIRFDFRFGHDANEDGPPTPERANAAPESTEGAARMIHA
jgi:hypothetical protein